MANLQTIINKKVFNKLSKQNQVALKTWTYWVWTSKLRDAGLEGRAQVAKDKAAGDLTIIDWPVSERAKFRKISKLQQIAEYIYSLKLTFGDDFNPPSDAKKADQYFARNIAGIMHNCCLSLMEPEG